MATRVPPSRKAKAAEPRSNAEVLLEFIHETGPHHDLADAIESVYEERHRGFPSGPRGRSKRRESKPM